MGTPPPCLQPSFRNRPNPKKVGYPVRVIKDMKSVNGKRTWLIGWEGEDENGDAWADSWEPSSFVSQDLMDAFLTDTAGRKDRVIEVDTRPLDNLVQKRIGRAALTEDRDSFGHKIVTDLPEMRLADIAWNYFESYKRDFPDAEVSVPPIIVIVLPCPF
jgi:hypothetical protein